MAIVKMHKFNLYTFASDRQKILETLQKFQDIHLSELKLEDEQKYLAKVEITEHVMELDAEIQNVKWALELLTPYIPTSSMVDNLKTKKIKLTMAELRNSVKGYDFKPLYEKLNSYVSKKSELSQAIVSTQEFINELEPFSTLNISGAELKNLNRVKVITGNIPQRNENLLKDALEKSELSLYSVEEFTVKNGSKYLIILVDPQEEEEMSNILRTNGFTNVRINTDKKVQEEIEIQKLKIENDKKEIDEVDKKVADEVKEIEKLRYYYEFLKNERLKEASVSNFMQSKTVDFITGYIPSEKAQEFKSRIESVMGNDYYLELEKANTDDENVPIKLKNNKLIEPFESITEMYAIPKYQEIDPTPLLAPFYFVFSGIMIGDMGYGLLVTLACLAILKLFKPEKVKARMIKFVMYMGISSTFWGFIFGSFFGDVVPMKAYMNPSEDYMTMIAMCMLFGVIHIFFAMGIKAYMNIRDHKPLDALFDVGFWYMALIGAIIFVGSKVIDLGALVGKISMIVMLIGMVGILLTGGRDQESTVGKIGWGVYALYGISSYLGDFVSYFRLMALALSGSFIAIAVNIIVKMLMAQGILGIIFGIIVFIAFQIFNMFLSFLSAYVHSARLTFVEMFNKFYEGGGVPFKEMVTQSDYFIIEED